MNRYIVRALELILFLDLATARAKKSEEGERSIGQYY